MILPNLTCKKETKNLFKNIFGGLSSHYLPVNLIGMEIYSKDQVKLLIS